MDYQLPRQSFADRLRARRVSRRIERSRFGNRSARSPQRLAAERLVFGGLSALFVAGAVLLALG